MNLIRGFPPENRHGDSVGTVQIPFHLHLQVAERVEAQMIVKTFLVVTMASFRFSVMPRCPRTNQLVLNVVFVAKYIQRAHAVCFRGMRKLRSVICLQNVRSVAEEFDCPFEEVHRGETALFFIRVDEPIPRRFIYDAIPLRYGHWDGENVVCETYFARSLLFRHTPDSIASGTLLRYDTSDRQKICPLFFDKLLPRGILFPKGVDNIAFLCYNLSR